MFICYICNQPVALVKNYLSHLRLNHAIHHVGVEVQCGQEDCPRTFTNFRYLKTHLEYHHSHLADSCPNKTLTNCSEICAHESANYNSWDDGAVIVEEHCEQQISHTNITTSFMTFIGQLQSKANISLKNIQLITENLQLFLDDVAQYSMYEVKKLAGQSLNDHVIQNFLSNISGLPNCLKPVDSIHKRWVYMKNSGFLIEPE